MRTPEFWRAGRGGLAGTALSPLGALYGAAGALRQRMAQPRRIGIPVICVGNIVAGGAGKTPTALALALALQAKGLKPQFLTRGYGGRLAGPVQVDLATHDAAAVGDEALLLARKASTWVARNRVAGGRAAEAARADIVIMDDGHQNPHLAKDLSIIVVDGGFGFGSGRLFPAGPLREPVARGLARANAIVIIGPDTTGMHDALRNCPLPVLHAELLPGMEAYEIGERAVVAFAGIGRPEKFFETLEGIGCQLVGRHSYPDHHRFSPDEIMSLVEEAAGHGAELVTTEKDWVRLDMDSRAMIRTLPVQLEWRDPGEIDALFAPLLKSTGTSDGH